MVFFIFLIEIHLGWLSSSIKTSFWLFSRIMSVFGKKWPSLWYYPKLFILNRSFISTKEHRFEHFHHFLLL